MRTGKSLLAAFAGGLCMATQGLAADTNAGASCASATPAPDYSGARKDLYDR